MEQPEALRRVSPAIDARLESLLLPSNRDDRLGPLHGAMRYACLAPGKRVRPALCVLASEAVGGSIDDALDAACAIEMVHAFSLVHDDLPAIDNDELRRGSPTVHVEFGEALAILAGDALFARAFEVIASSSSPAERVVHALRRLTLASGAEGLVGGEVLDVLSEGLRADRELVDLIHIRKTGALIAAACAIGAELGGGSVEQVEALHRFGLNVGLAFQIADDLLNETATAAELGKAAGSDRRREKATYPAALGIDAARHAAGQAAQRGLNELDSFGADAAPLIELARFFIFRRN